MADGVAGTYPQVFVVDSQASYSPLPSAKSTRWASVSQKLLLLLVGLALLGVVVEGCFTYYLYNKSENLPQTPHQPGGTMNQMGSKGSGSPVGKDNVVQWVHTDGDAFTYRMGYNNGCLLVQEEGYYYLYSKVHLNAAEECSAIKHKVMKNTTAYDQPLELMKSNRFHCRTQRSSSAKDQKEPVGDDLWNSFLGGVFHLRPGEEIYVTLEDGKKMRLGTADNFMGAFMI
ncbi:tumor necrosis factor ligand superfamily member 14-like [Diretmus argenteus]